MKHFSHMDASSASEASKNLKSGTAWAIAGGTDLIGTLKDEILPTYPEKLVNLKTIPGLDKIVDEGNQVRIGALVKLADVASSDVVQNRCAALAEAAGRVASPTIRTMSTLGGNMCQMHRCWYFRAPNDRFHCKRKGGKYCPARIGDNRYHSIFGNQNGCYAINSQDTATALVALGAQVKTTSRTIEAEKFFVANGVRSCALEDGEVVTEVIVPAVQNSAFEKFALRKSIDFAVASCAVAKTDDGVRVVLGGVYPAPWRSAEAEAEVAGGVSDRTAERAADAAVAPASPLAKNAYKVEIARTLVKRTLARVK